MSLPRGGSLAGKGLASLAGVAVVAVVAVVAGTVAAGVRDAGSSV
ncbi:hypothetical protein [Halobaculum sp. CBA1158]|nr:hypothetical protein [Halobaculum sp. CBA1158]